MNEEKKKRQDANSAAPHTKPHTSRSLFDLVWFFFLPYRTTSSFGTHRGVGDIGKGAAIAKQSQV